MGYKMQGGFGNQFVDSDISDGMLTSFRLPRFLPLAQRAQFTQALSAVAPVLEACDTDNRKVLQEIETLLGQPVGLMSFGQTADNIQIINPLPV